MNQIQKTVAFALALVAASSIAGAASNAPAPAKLPVNVNREGVVNDGYDVLAYLTDGKPGKGPAVLAHVGGDKGRVGHNDRQLLDRGDQPSPSHPRPARAWRARGSGDGCPVAVRAHGALGAGGLTAEGASAATPDKPVSPGITSGAQGTTPVPVLAAVRKRARFLPSGHVMSTGRPMAVPVPLASVAPPTAPVPAPTVVDRVVFVFVPKPHSRNGSSSGSVLMVSWPISGSTYITSL